MRALLLRRVVLSLALAGLLAACGSSEPSGQHVVIGFTFVSAGQTGTCGLSGNGALACWGEVPPGADFDTTFGTNPASLGATSVPAITTFTALAVAKTAWNPSGCAVGVTGQVYCWGALDVDADATLSLGSGIAPLAGATSAASVSVDFDHLCVTRTDNLVRCYGMFAGGARGTDSVVLATVDPDVSLVPNGLSPSLSAFGTAQGRLFGCALRTDSLVACWGSRHHGQLGGAVGDSVQNCISTYAADWCQPGPALVAGGHKYRQLSASEDHACAVRIDGTVDCWGRKPGVPGPAGFTSCSGTADCPNTPTQVALPGTAVRVVVGFDHACALLSSGAAYCWGRNDEGQLGRPGATSVTPVEVAGGYSFATISAGAFHTCGVELGTGVVGCWGANTYGQLGDGTLVNRDHPVPVVARQ